tara:strand:+ start:455 stop:802 length:348 start_codon:yes stop_codon:yes gene_type:complete
MTEENDAKDDFEYSRSTYYELLDKGREGLDLMMEVARESEHPRAFEVLSSMIKQQSEVTDRLMDLQKKKVDLNGPKKEEKKQLTQNNVFVGSTADLQKMLSGEMEVIEHDTDGTD